MFEFSLGLSKHILIANMADTASIEDQRQQFFQPMRCSQDMSCSLSSGNKTSKTSTFELPKIFSEFFSPSFRWVFACGLASGFGSRGQTPLHWAARSGRDSVVQRLLEAKAAVDAKDKTSRGLGGGFGGETS